MAFTTMASPLFLLLLLLLPLAAAAADPSAIRFLRSSCAATLYPSLCFSSLLPFTSTFGSDPTRLATTATNITLARIHSTSALFSSTAATYSTGSSRASAALKDCRDNFGDAADLVEQSLEELQYLLMPGGVGKAEWHVGNAQTWISAALTYEETCTDGFDPSSGGPGGKLAADVGAKVKKVKEYTSNALALVNKLVSNHR